ncbi:hypothetical protein [Capnocytophaga sp.]|uniref:hypothetical protein n=1 Tax=Capnocytophaga sp. TaxID=44737 RepID=UPI0026DB546B|nr:hypothetical protein [Capnocytophaga sp.]MDO5104509.1 hypothetical protein [Capnocytophaga sp.]
MELNALFFEKQKLLPDWIKIGLWLFCLLFIYWAYRHLFVKNPFGESPILHMVLLFLVLFWFVVILTFSVMNISLTLTNQSVKIEAFPFSKKTIPIKEIQAMELITYRKMKAGIRISSQYGKVYHISGNKGLFISLKNGETVLVSVKNIEKLREALNSDEHLKILLKHSNLH